MYELRQILPEAEWDQVRLLIIGGCRGQEDERLVQVSSNPEFGPFKALVKGILIAIL
jgi:hypothetical protein